MKEFEPFEGLVVGGKRLGRTLGFHTANLEASCRLERGVYAVWVILPTGARCPGMMNVGLHPTLPEGAPTVEVHLLNFEDDLYGQRLSVEPLFFVRGERRFESVEALKAQLDRDRETVAALLKIM